MGCLPRSALFLVTESHSLMTFPKSSEPFRDSRSRNGLEVARGHDLNENEIFYYKKTVDKPTNAKEPLELDKTKVECYNYHKIGHFARECRIKGTQDNRRRDAWNSGNKDGSRTG
ncbi:ribonuclease H-like domain-containing protein [Tanacetum coccineum]